MIRAMQLLLLTGVSLACVPSRAEIVLEFTGGSTTNSSLTRGWAFSVGTSLVVDELLVWDEHGDGLIRDKPIAIWLDGGAQMVQGTVQPGGGTPFVTDSNGEVWRLVDVEDVTLDPGTYVIGMDMDSNDNAMFTSTASTMSGVTYLENRYSLTTWLERPALTDALFDDGFFGPNFTVVPIPEPSTLTLAALGILGLTFYGWRRRSKQRANHSMHAAPATERLASRETVE